MKRYPQRLTCCFGLQFCENRSRPAGSFCLYYKRDSTCERYCTYTFLLFSRIHSIGFVVVCSLEFMPLVCRLSTIDHRSSSLKSSRVVVQYIFQSSSFPARLLKYRFGGKPKEIPRQTDFFDSSKHVCRSMCRCQRRQPRVQRILLCLPSSGALVHKVGR